MRVKFADVDQVKAYRGFCYLCDTNHQRQELCETEGLSRNLLVTHLQSKHGVSGINLEGTLPEVSTDSSEPKK